MESVLSGSEAEYSNGCWGLGCLRMFESLKSLLEEPLNIEINTGDP